MYRKPKAEWRADPECTSSMQGKLPVRRERAEEEPASTLDGPCAAFICLSIMMCTGHGAETSLTSPLGSLYVIPSLSELD
jgi:hypothetical protein